MDSEAGPLDSWPERPSNGAMNRLSAIERATRKAKTTNFNVALTAPARASALKWLDDRPSASWVYIQGDNFHFASASDAAAFRIWLMGEAVG